MTLVPLVEGDDFAPDDQTAMRAARSGYGQLLQTWQAIANSPGLFSAYLPFLQKVAGAGDLDVRLKILVALRVAVLNRCDYTLSHRWSAGTTNSIPAELLTAAAEGTYAGPDDRIRAALEVTQLITLGAPTVSRTDEADIIPATVRARLQSLFTPPELVELVMGIGVWNALTRFHRALGLELDMPAAPDSLRALL